MKQILLLLTIIVGGATALCAQDFTVLLVNDDGYSVPSHITNIQQAIGDAGMTFGYFNAVVEGGTPSVGMLKQYDLVIWYAGIDGEGLHFWSGTDSVNTALKSYLDGGGRLWVLGSDVLYDAYGLAPVTFQPGSFAYDYLGVAQYKSQSHADDGGGGVPWLEKNADAQFAMPGALHWHDSLQALWWVDGCVPVTAARAVYLMAPTDYQLSGQAAAIYKGDGAPKVFSCFFDPYYIDTRAARTDFFRMALDWFQQLRRASGVDAGAEPFTRLRLDLR